MHVKIQNLTFNTIIGILPHERTQEQSVIVDCSFDYTYANGNFVDYSKVAQNIKELMKEKQFELLEDAVLYIKDYLKQRYKIKNSNCVLPNLLFWKIV